MDFFACIKERIIILKGEGTMSKKKKKKKVKELIRGEKTKEMEKYSLFFLLVLLSTNKPYEKEIIIFK